MIKKFILLFSIFANSTLFASTYTIQLPQEWKQIVDETELEERVNWTVINFNFAIWGEKPESITAWRAEQLPAMLTISYWNEDPRYLSHGYTYNDHIFGLNQSNFVILETGTTQIHNEQALWWTQGLPFDPLEKYIPNVQSSAYQYCLTFSHEGRFYMFSFTTRDKPTEELRTTLDRAIKTFALNE